MADIHIEREHSGPARGTQNRLQMAEQAEKEFDMACTYEEGTTSDCLSFSRSGVRGTLSVTANDFELRRSWVFWWGMFKEKIEAEIIKNLDTLIDKKTASIQLAAKSQPPKRTSPESIGPARRPTHPNSHGRQPRRDGTLPAMTSIATPSLPASTAQGPLTGLKVLELGQLIAELVRRQDTG